MQQKQITLSLQPDNYHQIPLKPAASEVHPADKNQIKHQRYSENVNADIKVLITKQKTFRQKLVQAIPQQFTQQERKRQDQRIYRIEELIQTQRIFIRDVNNVLQLIRKPLIQQKIIETNDEKIIFSSLPQIFTLNSAFYHELNGRWLKYTHKQMFGDILVKNAPFFKIYSSYVSNYQKGTQLIQRLRLQKQQLNILLKNFEQNVAMKDKKRLRDYFIQPFQRFTKYKLLISQIVKRTNKNHPDYQNLKKAQKKFAENVQSMNLITDAILKANKINYIQDKFGTQKDPINIKGRTYLFEEKLFWLKNELQIIVTVYFMNDLVLFTHNQTNQILLKMPWNQKCFIETMKEGKTIRNAIYIVTENQTAIVAPIPRADIIDQNQKLMDLKTTKNRIMQAINNQMVEPLKHLARQSTQVKVIILGNEQMNSTTISKHTLYILQLKISNFRQNLFVRYSWVIDFLNKIQQHYPSLKQLAAQKLQKKIFTNHTSKTIEYRGIKIQQILQKVLNNKQVLHDPTFVIKELNLPKNFYDISNILNQKEFILKRMNSNLKSGLTTYQLFCQIQRRLGRYVKDHEQQQEKIEPNQKKYIIEIKLTNDKIYNLQISSNTTVEKVCRIISKKIGLKLNRDYRLFNEATKKQCRVLDYDCVIAKHFTLKQKSQEDSGKFFQSIKKSIKEIFNQGKASFIFKKYYYLSENKQAQEYKHDIIRLELLANQIYQEVLDCKYKLQFKQFCFLIALILQEKGKKEVIESEQQLKKLIPEIIYKKQKFKEWHNQIQKSYIAIDQKIQNILQKNKQISQKIDEEDKQFYLQRVPLSYQIAINFIKSNRLYGANLFFIQINQQLLTILKKNYQKISHNMYLAITNKGLELLSSSKSLILEIPYHNISKKQFHPTSILIQLKSQKGIDYVLNTSQSFEISKLIEFYQIYNQTKVELKIE